MENQNGENEFEDYLQLARKHLGCVIKAQKQVLSDFNDHQAKLFDEWSKESDREFRGVRYHHWKEAEGYSDAAYESLLYSQSQQDVVIYPEYREELLDLWQKKITNPSNKESGELRKSLSNPQRWRRKKLKSLLDSASTIVKSKRLVTFKAG